MVGCGVRDEGILVSTDSHSLRSLLCWGAVAFPLHFPLPVPSLGKKEKHRLNYFLRLRGLDNAPNPSMIFLRTSRYNNKASTKVIDQITPVLK